MILEDLDTTVAPAATAVSVINPGVFIVVLRVAQVVFVIVN
ncbi:hypothetical protein [Rudaea sp.]